MLPVSSMRVYADNNIPENTISLQPTSVELSPSAVHSQIPFTVSAEKTENVEDIQIFFQEGTLTDGSYTIPFKVNKDPEASEGNRWASFTFRSDSYSNTMAVIVNSASLSSANAGVYMGYLQWNAGFWTHESEKIKDINGQILMTLKIGYDITVSSNANGTVSSSCSMARAGETVTLDVAANAGYQFKEWQIVSGNVTIENNQFTMPEGDVEICAVFDKLCEVNFEANGGSGTMDSDTFFASEGYTLPSCGFTAPDGYTFKDWTVTWENEGATYGTNKMAGSILTGITEDIMVSANWMDLSLKVSPSGAGSVVYENGAFTATANAGYTFDHWEYADDEYSTTPIGTVWPTENPYQPTQVDHKIYTAVFKANTYNLTVLSNNDERGTVTYSGTPKTGNTITLTATANEGYIFKEWQIEPEGIAINANNKFKMPASNVTVTAVFVPQNGEEFTRNTVTGTNVTLGDELGLNFYFTVPAETVESGAKAVLNGPKGEQEVLLSDAPKDGDEYKLTYRVNAIQADSDITLKIVDSDNVTLDLYNAVGSKYENGIMTYSVNRYLIDAMNYDGITNKAPIRATYTYCAYACKWKNGTALPTDGYINDLSNPSADALDAFKVVKTNTSNSIKITGYSLVLDSKTAIRVYFTATDAIQDHVIKVGDKTLTPVLSGNTVDNRNEYYVEITNIGAGNLETQYTVVFDPASDNYQVKISAMSYVRNVMRQKDQYPEICTEELCDLVTAIYDYAEIFK